MNYYQILEVSESADGEQIKKAYRRQANKNHPDKNQNSKSAEDRMQKVNEAYEVLSHQSKRKNYDNSQKSSNSQKSNFYQSEPNFRKSRDHESRNENSSFKKAYEEKTTETDRQMKDREQRIKSAEDILKKQQEKFKKTRRRFWVVVAIIAVAVGLMLLQSARNANVRYRDLTTRNDSLSLELRTREFLINEGLEKSNLQKVKSFLSVYELNRIGVHTYSSVEMFKKDMRDVQKAKELYERLLKANVSINMNFDQFYRIVKFD